MKRLISVILVILAISCKTNKEEITNYFGGEIINPKSDHVLFLKDDRVIDTLFLDEYNRFINKYESLDGLYTFKHGNEFQYIYMEPADSILVRLNTWDFDESLVFSGKGSNKNNYLISLFLQNEKEEMAMYQYFSLNPSDFQFKLDSLAKARTVVYNEFSKNETEISEGLHNLIHTAIHFPLYRLNEIYPLYHKYDTKSDEYPVVPDSFYTYRNDVSLNEANLVSYYGYQNYVISHLYNLSYALKENDSTKDDITLNILNSIVDNVELESFKNTLLKRITVDNFLNSASTSTINEQTLSLFLDNCTDNGLIMQVKNLVRDAEYVVADEPLHNFEILSYDNQILDINSIVENKNSMIYFWTTEHIPPDYLLKKIQYLEQNFPNIEFIGINIQSTSKDVLKEPSLKKLNINKQYKLTANSYANKYLTSNYPRIIIVNKKGIVKNGFTLLRSKNLNSELKKLEIN